MFTVKERIRGDTCRFVGTWVFDALWKTGLYEFEKAVTGLKDAGTYVALGDRSFGYLVD